MVDREVYLDVVGSRLGGEIMTMLYIIYLKYFKISLKFCQDI